MAIFAQVADSGSFTAAARLLELPKSTVSQRVAELEAMLGLRLLQRTTRKLNLTEAGQTYLSHCQAMLLAAQAADAAVSRLRDAPAGVLRLTAPEASGIKLLPAMLAAFRQAHPLVEVHCQVTDAHLDLVGERIDLAFRTGRLEDSSFVSRRIGSVGRVLVASPPYLAARGEPHAPQDLLRHACLRHHSAPQWRLGEETITLPSGGQGSNSLLYLLQAALLGGGIAMLPAFLCREEMAAGQLLRVLTGYPPPPNDYYAVYPSRSHPTAALSALLDFVLGYDLAGRLA
ncbi:LysR family transcriptional regulator [Chitinimonas arctica]|uniref:LysR family transcriptional regulator n=2 Tax=Chitinimonas arctica TaxID=2594795 RepID=A0A516SMD6_9NEIS|nr:LysR family transcriptional regulator [Chitinimonas arctica]